MPAFTRYVLISEEATYASATVTPALYLDLAGESLKRKPLATSIRPERRVSAMRQTDRGRSVSGNLDVHLGYVGLSRMLRWICSTPTSEDLGSGAWRDTFVPSPKFRPASVLAGIPRDVEVHNNSGLFFNAARLSFGLGDQYFGLSLSCLGADEQPGGAVPSVLDTAFEEPAAILDRGAATPLSIVISDGVTTWQAATQSVDLNFAWDRKPRMPERRLTATGIMGGGVASASGKVKWFYGADTDFLLDAFRSRTPMSLTLTMQGALIGGGIYETLEVHFPVCKVNADPPTLKGAGAGNIDFAVDMESFYSTAVGYPFRFRVTSGAFEQELLVNPGDEAGITGSDPTGWTHVGTATWVQDNRVGDVGGSPGSDLFPGPHSGSYFFSTLTAASTIELRQDVDVSRWATWIDSGVQRFAFMGYYFTLDQGPGSDTAQVRVEYLNQAGTVLDAYDTGVIQHFDTWAQLSDTRVALIGTRTIRVRMMGVLHFGAVVNAHFDDFSLKALRLA